MRLVLLEDDHFQADDIIAGLQQAFRLTAANVLHIRTESEFRERLTEITGFQPDVVILDVMVRWCDPGPDMPPAPPDICEQGPFRAGIRCYQILSEEMASRRLPRTPIVFYTVVSEERVRTDLGGTCAGNVRILTKANDISPLVQLIRVVTGAEH